MLYNQGMSVTQDLDFDNDKNNRWLKVQVRKQDGPSKALLFNDTALNIIVFIQG